MKRVDLLKKLTEAGFTFKEGGRHTLVYKDNALITQVPRHREVEERLAKKIFKDAGIK